MGMVIVCVVCLRSLAVLGTVPLASNRRDTLLWAASGEGSSSQLCGQAVAFDWLASETDL